MTLKNTLQLDIQSVNSLKKDVTNELKNAELAARIFERTKSQAGLGYSQLNFSQPSPYLSSYLTMINSVTAIS